MKRLINIAVDLGVACAVIAGELYQIDAAYNIAIFMVWIMIILGMLMVAYDSKLLFKEVKKLSYIPTYTGFILIISMVYCGWFFTAALLTFIELLLLGKKLEYFEKLNA